MQLKIFMSDNGNWENHAQKVWCDKDDINLSFDVYDLSECPEDAIIGRDLFDADDYINAVRLGMKLAAMGFDGLSVENIPWED